MSYAMRKAYTPSVGELQAFCACARLGTTTLAADELNLTQSAISRALLSLEERLGLLLFTRARQRLHLAPAGHEFLPKALKILQDIDEAAVSAMAFGGSASVLRIATLPSFGRHWLIPRLAQLAQSAPDLGLDLAVRLTPVDFSRESFDCAIMRKTHQPAGSHAELLLPEKLILACHPRLLRANATLSPQDLLSRPLLQQSTRPTLWLDWFKQAGLDPRLARRGARAEHFDMLLDMACAGMGIALVPEALTEDLLASGKLARASAESLATGEDYVLITPAQNAHPALAQLRQALL